MLDLDLQLVQEHPQPLNRVARRSKSLPKANYIAEGVLYLISSLESISGSLQCISLPAWCRFNAINVTFEGQKVGAAWLVAECFSDRQ